MNLTTVRLKADTTYVPYAIKGDTTHSAYVASGFSRT
jgi:hypothetical protein